MEGATTSTDADEREELSPSRQDIVEGDWLAIALEEGYALGRIVLLRPATSSVFVSFFARRFDAQPSSAELRSMSPSEARIALQCSDAPIRDGSWSLVSDSSYEPSDWPLPWFSYSDHANRRYWLLRAQRGAVGASEDRVRRVTRKEAEAHPANVVLHRRAVEEALEARLMRLGASEEPL